jgi:hypothetical protein
MKRSADGLQSLYADTLQIKKTKFLTSNDTANVTFPSGTYTIAKVSDIGVLPIDIVRETTVQTITNKDLSSSTNTLPSNIVREATVQTITNKDLSSSTNTLPSNIVREATVQTITNKDLSSNTNILPSDIVRTTEDNVVNITNGNQSTSTSTGALIVAGGLGVGKNTHFGGTIHAPVGTVAVPTFSFISDPNTGIFQNGDNVLGVAANGNLSATFSESAFTSVNPITIPIGSLSNCAIQFSGDPNTGIISAGADQLSLVCGGGARMILSGITCQLSPPIRASNGTAAAPSLSFSGDTDTGMYSNGANSIGFTTNGILRQTIDSTRITTTIPIQLPSVGGIASDLDYYEVWNSSITFFYSITNSFQWVINIVRIGKNVTFHFGDDANLYTIANGPRQITCAAGSIPTRFRPGSNSASLYLYLQFNAPSTFTWVSGKIIINSDGSISLSPQNSNFNTGDQLYIQRHSTTIFAA